VDLLLDRDVIELFGLQIEFRLQQVGRAAGDGLRIPDVSFVIVA
jgi:hypothetical protein